MSPLFFLVTNQSEQLKKQPVLTVVVQVIKRSQGLDEVLARLNPEAASQHFASIQRWREKRELACPRKGKGSVFVYHNCHNI